MTEDTLMFIVNDILCSWEPGRDPWGNGYRQEKYPVSWDIIFAGKLCSKNWGTRTKVTENYNVCYGTVEGSK